MGRRIFEERNFILQGHVLPLEQFRLFTDLEKGFEIPVFRVKEMLHKAEAALKEDIPQLLASDYMRFCEDGNRSAFEDKYFLRRISRELYYFLLLLPGFQYKNRIVVLRN